MIARNVYTFWCHKLSLYTTGTLHVMSFSMWSCICLLIHPFYILIERFKTLHHIIHHQHAIIIVPSTYYSPCAVLSTCALNYSTCTYQILFETHVFVFILCRNIKEYYAIILCISIICFYIIPQLQVFIFRIHNRARCS